MNEAGEATPDGAGSSSGPAGRAERGAERGTARRRGPLGRSFTGRLVLVQIAVVLVTLVLALGAAAAIARSFAWNQAEQEALRLARLIASDPQVRTSVSTEAAKEKLDPAALRDGPLQRAAEAYRGSANVLFVVITDEEGLRLTHPTPDLIGERVSTDPQALDGSEVVLRERGTLGDSVRAKVPVRELTPGAGGSGAVVGEVSLGLNVSEVAGEARGATVPVLGVAAAAVLVAALAGWWLARRLRAGTLGLGPEEISQLVRDQEAVLHGVAEGVVGLAPDGRVTVINPAAQALVGSSDVSSWPEPLRRAVESGAPGPLRLAVGERIVVLARRGVTQDGRDLGSVLTLRDLTDVEDLGVRLEGVETMAQALRVQRHEFANRLHTIGGLLALGATQDASDYLAQITGSAPAGTHVPGLEAVGDTYLAAFLGAKAVQAGERGVQLRVGEQSQVSGRVVAAQDATAVLGNLLDNALRAAATAAIEGTQPWVEVDLLSDGDTLHLAVLDSGAGVDPGLDLFAEGVSSGTPDAGGHSLGVGLPLARRVARARGGDVWLADAGGDEGPDGERLGAVFCARLPQVMEADAAVSAQGGASALPGQGTEDKA